MRTSYLPLILISVWLFAIFAPPIISVLGEDGTSIITLNLNEEEQQEQGKKTLDEKQVVVRTSTSLLVLSRLQNTHLYDFYLLGNSDHSSEIVLPPPEQYS